jgi:hypothetical protein
LGGSLFLLLVQAAYSVDSWNQPRTDLASLTLADGKTSTPIGLALTGVRVDQLDEPNEQLRRGMSGYLFPFVIISMHLLVVLIGAAYMARTKRLSTRTVTALAAPAAPRERRRSLFAVVGIVSGMVANAILAAACFAYMMRPAALATQLATIDPYLEPAAKWLWPLLGALFLVNIVLLVGVDGWQKWGIVGLVVVTLVQSLAIGNSGLPTSAALVFLVLAMAPVAILIMLLTTGPRPTMWEQMD